MTPPTPAAVRVAELPFHLVEEINHRVVNEYAEAICSLSLAARSVVANDTRSALNRAADRLRAYAEIHRALMPPADGRVDLADYTDRLCSAISRASLAPRQIHLTVHAEEIWLSSARAWRIGLAIAELVRNAARHGLAGQSGAIAVSLAERDGEILCGVGDNGSSAAECQPGRGVGLVRALAAELGGSADWRFAADGCLARLHVPLEAREP